MSRTYIRFVSFLVLFGAIVSVVTSVFNFQIQYRNLDKEIARESSRVAQNRIELLHTDLRHVEDDLHAIVNNPLFYEYLDNPSDAALHNATALLLSHAEANKNYFQIRYIDRNGMEIIRVDENRNTGEYAIVGKDSLQNKSDRYYFRETRALSGQQTWRSKLDLNVERGEIEEPIRPTIRIAVPVFRDGDSRGILIINVDMGRTLSLIGNIANFRMSLVDGDGYFLIHPDVHFHWGRYLGGNYLLQNVQPELAKAILSENTFHSSKVHAFSLEETFKNREGLRLVLETKQQYVSALTHHNIKVTLFLALLILGISIPVGMLIALWPARIERALKNANEQNLKQLSIIDKYVMTFDANAQGKIIAVSTALSKLLGYNKEQILGMEYSRFLVEESPGYLHKEILSSVKGGFTWSGELESLDKTGVTHWLDAVALPSLGRNNPDGYTTISTDITDKKRIIKLSEEDSLTGLYNRLKLDKVLADETQRNRRYRSDFSCILLDIDHFKEVNDKYGHPVGDAVLKSVSSILASHVRGTDIVGRWGGEEFIVLCVETAVEGALELAEKLRKAIEGYQFPHGAKQTSSFGVTQFLADDSVESFIKRADEALYRAKNNGRNCVEVY